MRPTLDNLQSLRGLACLAVVLFHVGQIEERFRFRPMLSVPLRWFGYAGVDLFFVISGFIITHSNAHRLGRPRALPGYLFRRLWRVYPAYWFALGTAALVAVWVYRADVRQFDWQGSAACWFGLWPGNHFFLPQAWTLTFELLFYLAFGLLIVLPPRAGAVLLAAWGGAAAVAAVRPPTDFWTDFFAKPYVLEFLAGCLVSWLVRRERTGFVRPAGRVAAVWVVIASVLLNRADSHWLEWTAGPRVLVFGLPATLAVYACVAAERRTGWRLPDWTRTLGDASYSIYLIHMPVIAAMTIWTLTWPHNRVPHAAWLLVMTAACLGTGLLMHRLVERPLMNLIASKPRRPVERPAGWFGFFVAIWGRRETARR